MQLKGDGRPTLLDDAVMARVLEAIPKVYTYEQVAGMCELEPSTMRKWLYRGKKEHIEGIDSIYVKFFLAYKKKRAEVAESLLSSAFAKKFRAASWVLERTYRLDYGIHNEDQKRFYDALCKKLSKVGIKMEEYETFMEDIELQPNE